MTDRAAALQVINAARAALIRAQHEGDLAHATALAQGRNAYDAYHETFTDTMRNLGQPVACACERCRALAEPESNVELRQLAAS